MLDKMGYGNEGKSCERARVVLPQMTEMFLWIGRFHLCTGIGSWLEGTVLETVDLPTWDKQRMGMGYRPRRQAEYPVVL